MNDGLGFCVVVLRLVLPYLAVELLLWKERGRMSWRASHWLGYQMLRLGELRQGGGREWKTTG